MVNPSQNIDSGKKGRPPKKMSNAEANAVAAVNSAVIRGYTKQTIEELRQILADIRRAEGKTVDEEN